ncbi:PAS domain-containing sensor histidine kinase [Polaribacter glomeratus]|uniref:histidine kinase n=1 Tax=Polaribacter glomeratus TaxID=102 RepID=A0A2S7WXV6_9FLAO|nr:PAS domain-containing protein [Polaribacter glomeratus]PQJ82251.1 hypothetical protein BTO16_06535 [Polaribacter glomeratus]TXD66846.1 PAS domain S-box protein [Polaribacter glomeratus]
MLKKKPTYKELEEQIKELKSDDKLKKSEDRINMLLKASDDMITIHKTNGRYIYYNGPTRYAIALKDIVGKKPKDLFDQDTSKVLLDGFRKVVKTGESETIEVLLDWLGEKKWFSEYMYPIKNDTGKVVEIVKVCRDIDKRKIAELEIENQNKLKDKKATELVLSEKRLNEAQATAKIGSWELDLLTFNIYWSPEQYRIFEMENTPAEKLYKTYRNKINRSEKTELDRLVRLAIKTGNSYEFEHRILCNDGSTKYILGIGKPSFDANGKAVSINGTVQDITQSKTIKKELDHQNKKLDQLNNALNQAQKLSNIGSWQWNMTTDKAEWSDEMYNIYGVSKEHFYPSNENVTKTVVPQDLHKVEKGISALLIDKIFIPFEFRIKRPCGEIRTLYIMALEKNSQDSIFGVTKDITEQKHAEDKNRRIEEDFKELFDNAAISIWNEDFTLVYKHLDELRKLEISNIKIYLEQNPEIVFSLLSKVKVTNVNKATLKLFKAKNNQDFLNNIQLTFGDGAEKVFINLIEAIWNNEKTFTSEVNYKTLEGDEFAALFSIPIPQKEGNQKTVPISIQSIQNIKDAKLAKKESLKKLNEAQKLAHIGSWLYNLSTQNIEWSNETFHIWGFDPKKNPPELEELINLIHPEDQELFISAVSEAISLKKPYDLEHRICLQNGTQKTIRSVGQTILDENNKILRLAGTTQDITLKKLLEEEKYNTKLKLQNISNELIQAQKLAKVGSWLYNLSTQEKEWSEEMYHIWGFDITKPIPEFDTALSLIHTDDLELYKEAVNKAVNLGVPYDIEFRIILSNNEQKTVKSICQPVFDNNNKVTSLSGANQDITAQKLFEEAQSKHQRLKAIGEMSSSIAHDFNNSLQQMMGNLEVVKIQNELSTSSLDRLNTIGTIITDVASRVKALQKFGDTENINKNAKLFDLNILIEESLKESNPLWKNTLDSKFLKIDITTDFGNIPKINCNKGEIKSVIFNLIKNSIEAMPKGGVLNIKTGLNATGVFATFTDTGIGMDTETRLKVFQPFFSTKGFKLGRGLGMSGAYGIIKKHRGDIVVKSSKINKGTCIEIIFPRGV